MVLLGIRQSQNIDLIPSVNKWTLQTGHIIEVAVYSTYAFLCSESITFADVYKTYLYVSLLDIVREPGEGLIPATMSGGGEAGDKSDSQVGHFIEGVKIDQWRYVIILH